MIEATALPYSPAIPRQRRYRRTWVGHMDLLDILQGRLAINFAPMPADVELEHVAYDWERRGFYLILYSAEFPIVPDGEIIPYADDPLQQLRTTR